MEIKRKYVRKEIKLNGFYTVEASFIIPLVVMIFILIIYFTFYLYNHCIVKQAIYLAELRGQQLKNINTSRIENVVNEQMGVLLDEQVYQYQKKYSVSVSGNTIEARGKSIIENKMAGFGIYNKSELLSEGN